MNLFLEGFLLGMSLIVAIGPQNAFVLKNGIRKKFVFVTPLTTSLCDAILIIAGVFGCGQILNHYTLAKLALMISGVLFLFLYGLRCLINVFKEEALTVSKTDNINNLKKIILYAVGLSFLNPHAILDSLVIIGSVSSSYAMADAVNFCLGLIVASTAWFFAISLFASGFSKYLAKPIVWKIIDASVSIICFKIAYSLLKDILAII